MARKAFYSFYYKLDNWRASQVRNMGLIEGNLSVSDNDWETISGGGDPAIQKWIDDQIYGKSCTIVLVGNQTANRKWINYEITKSWNDGKGVLGINIHNLKDKNGHATIMGLNPFDFVFMKKDGKPLSEIVKCYDPPFFESTDVYSYISKNLLKWAEEAIEIRGKY
jgi:hypothetical protein